MTSEAEAQIAGIMDDPARSGLQKQLKKALGNLSRNPLHPGLHSHPMEAFEKVYQTKVFSSYVQNNTPQAHRILWAYGPKPRQLTVLTVMPHYWGAPQFSFAVYRIGTQPNYFSLLSLLEQLASVRITTVVFGFADI